MIGLGDGRVLHYVYNPTTHALTGGKTFQVGTNPLFSCIVAPAEIQAIHFCTITIISGNSVLPRDPFPIRLQYDWDRILPNKESPRGCWVDIIVVSAKKGL